MVGNVAQRWGRKKERFWDKIPLSYVTMIRWEAVPELPAQDKSGNSLPHIPFRAKIAHGLPQNPTGGSCFGQDSRLGSIENTVWPRPSAGKGFRLCGS